MATGSGRKQKLAGAAPRIYHCLKVKVRILAIEHTAGLICYTCGSKLIFEHDSLFLLGSFPCSTHRSLEFQHAGVCVLKRPEQRHGETTLYRPCEEQKRK